MQLATGLLVYVSLVPLGLFGEHATVTYLDLPDGAQPLAFSADGAGNSSSLRTPLSLPD